MRILFVSGTRADYGKLKPLIQEAAKFKNAEVSVAVTGMHLAKEFGSTWLEIAELGLEIHRFPNMLPGDTMDLTLAHTISGLSGIIRAWAPTHVVIHGDRLEALAGAICSSFNNLITIHVEGGELSGTIDESIRHAVTKLSLVHLVSNEEAALRVKSMGENAENIHIIGSPELDIIDGQWLPEFHEVQSRYEIFFADYAVCLYHPVTTELDQLERNAQALAEALVFSGRNFVIIDSNNDAGYEVIREVFGRMLVGPRFRVLPSMRFEYYIRLIKHSQFLIGNSSSGVREAPYMGIPSINLGSRQAGRNNRSKSILNVTENLAEILTAIETAPQMQSDRDQPFGDGKSAKRFAKLLNSGKLNNLKVQKVFYTSD